MNHFYNSVKIVWEIFKIKNEDLDGRNNFIDFASEAKVIQK